MPGRKRSRREGPARRPVHRGGRPAAAGAGREPRADEPEGPGRAGRPVGIAGPSVPGELLQAALDRAGRGHGEVRLGARRAASGSRVPVPAGPRSRRHAGCGGTGRCHRSCRRARGVGQFRADRHSDDRGTAAAARRHARRDGDVHPRDRHRPRLRRRDAAGATGTGDGGTARRSGLAETAAASQARQGTARDRRGSAAARRGPRRGKADPRGERVQRGRP